MRLKSNSFYCLLPSKLVGALVMGSALAVGNLSVSYAAVNFSEYGNPGSGWQDTQPTALPSTTPPAAQPSIVPPASAAQWVNEQGLTTHGQAMLQTLNHAWEDGLSPSRYRVKQIEQLHQLTIQTPEHQSQLHDALLRAVALYAQDLEYGALPSSRHDRLNIAAERPSVETTIATIQQQSDVAAWLHALAPQSLIYTQMKRALISYHDIHKHGGWPKFQSNGSLKPGQTHPAVKNLYKILLATGDYSGPAPQHNLYHGALVDAVKQFQKRHGLTADGSIGPSTRAALNVPVEDRIDQIRLSMERIRELPNNFGNKYIIVNIPSFELTAYENGTEQLSMPVIVGRQERKTPLFSNQITTAEFNPVWYVPQSIARKDIIRHIQEDPDYLTKGNFTVSSEGEEIDPASIDWQSVDTEDFPYQFRQASGDKNALGKVKFTLPDNQSVYLHDTSDRRLFAKDFRALSSGCIRISDPKALAEYILKGNMGWDEKRIKQSFESSRNFAVPVTPVPVHTVYWTAWTDHTGQLNFRSDLYKKDKPLLAALGPLQGEEALQIASR